MTARILVVDDEPDFKTLILQKCKRKITNQEMEFFFATNGIEALEILTKRNDLDILLTDINMPKMDGLQLLAVVKKDFPLLTTLIVSAYSDMKNIRAAMNQGAFDFLTKPLDLDDLEITLDKTIIYARELKEKETIRLEKELAENKAKTKSLFLAHMSHEIRAPLMSVLGMTEILANTGMTLEQYEYVKTIRLSGQTLLSNINDLLDFSSIESKTLALESESFELSTCIEEAFDLLALRAMEKNIKLLYQIDVSVPQYVKSDINRLRQILINLVGNALKFTERGHVVISVIVHYQTKEELTLQFTVSDTGIGIKTERLNLLQAAFAQANTSLLNHYADMGLGLTICSQLVNLMGGKLFIESEENKGTKVNFTLCTPHTTGEIKETHYSSPIFANKKVLIIDNNKKSLEILCSLCHQWGLHTRTTSSSEEVLTILEKEKDFDLILIDHLIPLHDRIQKGEELQQTLAKARIPIILLTCKGEINSQEKDKEFFNAIVKKPVKQMNLFNQIKKIITGHKPKNGLEQTTSSIEEKSLFAKTYPANILVAEDNMINQKVAKFILHKIGYNPVFVMTGQEALEELKKKKYEILFMDIQMPDMDGLEATREINANYAAEKRPFIVAMTAYTQEEDRKRFLAAGMDAYISKPLIFEEVKNVIKKVCAPSTLVEEHQQSHLDTGLLEINVIREFMQDSQQSFYKDLYSNFFTQTKGLIRDLHSFEQVANRDRLRKTTHKIKGSSATVGAKKMVAICNILEQQSLKDHSRIFPLIEQLEQTLDETVSAFDSLNIKGNLK